MNNWDNETRLGFWGVGGELLGDPRQRSKRHGKGGALKLEITSIGDTEDDLVIALQEVIRHVEQGFTSGFGRNETGNYDFSITPRQEAP